MSRLRSAVSWGWYPTLIAVAVVLEPFVELDIDLRSGPRLLLGAATIGITATLVWARLLGRDRGAAAAAITVMGLVGATTLVKLLAFAAAIVLISLEGAWARRGAIRSRIPWRRLTEGLNVVLAIVVLLQVGRGAWLRVDMPRTSMPEAWSALPQVSGPDIFVILADGHGRRDVLQDRYGYDMAEFGASLDGAGMHESTGSHANHAFTRFSLSVLFNGRPLEELGQDTAAPPNEALPPSLMRNSSATRLLRAVGYEVTIIGSGYEHLGMRGMAEYRDVGPRNEVEQALLDRTALGRQIDALSAGYFSDLRTRILREVELLGTIARAESHRPNFVFVHLPAPHFPVVFEADCSPRPLDRHTLAAISRDDHIGDEIAVRAQADQTQCTDHLIGTTVGEVVAARPDAIVIVLSDHGPDDRLDWHEPDDPGVSDRMANLFWARTPGHPALFPEDITLVNVLPILLNAYLGTDLPLHSNDLWFGPTRTNDHFVRYVPLSP